MMLTEALTPADCVGPEKLRRADGMAIEWAIDDGLVDYPTALATMRARAAAIAAGTAAELVWLVEHPPLYTAGTSARPGDLLDATRFPVYDAGRGGEYTYHGPGQRVAYLMLDLRTRGRDVRCLVQGLEGWLIDALAAFNITGELRDGRIGVWVRQPGRPGGESKIAAIGVRVQRGVTMHGFALNVADLRTEFAAIVPCGLAGRAVTSLAELTGTRPTLAEVEAILVDEFLRTFGAPDADVEAHP